MTSVYEIVTNKIIEQLESVDVNNWQKPWFDIGTMPRNAISGKQYRGVNVFLLAQKGNAFASYKQWESKGCQVKKGSKSSLVTFWTPIEKEDKEKAFIMRYYNVFSADQVEGDFAREVEKPKTVTNKHERIANAETLINGYMARSGIGQSTGDCASYSPSLDRIQIPDMGQFNTPETYYSTFLHEAVHSTGHETRLKRDLKNGFGSRDYAFEELIAELGAAMLCAELGIDNLPRNDHAAYIKSWLRALKGDSKYVIQAASRAQKAADFIQGRTWENTETTEE